jgi:hypothetical protein
MVNKGNLAIDPRGLIYESYRIEGVTEAECRSIFLDWALGASADVNMAESMEILLQEYGEAAKNHPMTKVIREGLTQKKPPFGRRGGAMGRRR